MALSEESLREELKASMRSRDAVRTGALRAILAAVKNKTIESGSVALAEAELIAIIKREAKQCAETLAFARDAGREETVAEHKALLGVLESYLPSQLSESELRQAVGAIVAETGATQIGVVMKELATRHAGRFDGKLASTIVREVLSS